MHHHKPLFPLENLPSQVVSHFLMNNKKLQEERIEWIESETRKIDEFTEKITKHTLLIPTMNGDDQKAQEKIIKLNVGGSVFTTNLKTLLNEKDTFFSGFFSDRFLPQIQKVESESGEEEDVYFIDRNGKNFSLILDHLRGHKIGPKIQNLTGIELFEFVEDVAFYQVRSIYPLLNDESKEMLREHFSIELEEAPKVKETIPIANNRLKLTSHALANIPQEYKRMVLGETLHPFVLELEPTNAGKITGMLLEMETNMILNWIENDDELKKIVEQAVTVLKESSLYN